MANGQDWGQRPQYPQPGYGQQYQPGQPWQPQQYDPQQHQRRVGQPPSGPYASPPLPAVPNYTPQGYGQPPAPAVRKTGLTAFEKFWYVLGCIPMGAMYFAKIPAKKALADFGMAELTTAQSFWYVLMCIPFGAGYFAKIPTAKAISELAQFRSVAHVPLEYRH